MKVENALEKILLAARKSDLWDPTFDEAEKLLVDVIDFYCDLKDQINNIYAGDDTDL